MQRYVISICKMILCLFPLSCNLLLNIRFSFSVIDNLTCFRNSFLKFKLLKLQLILNKLVKNLSFERMLLIGSTFWTKFMTLMVGRNMKFFFIFSSWICFGKKLDKACQWSCSLMINARFLKKHLLEARILGKECGKEIPKTWYEVCNTLSYLAKLADKLTYSW